MLFLGGLTDARAAALARLAPALWNRRSDLRLFRFTRPVTGDEPGLVFGHAKYELLGRAKVLVNVHRDEGSDGYFEWARMVEAMANGCVVVTEPCRGHEPLVAGEHFVAAPLDSLADAVVDVLDDADRRSSIVSAAHAAVSGPGSLATQLAPVLDAAERALFSSAGATPARRPTRVPIQRTHRGPLLPEFRPFAALRTRLYHAIHAEIEHRREIGALRCTLRHGSPDHVERCSTPTWEEAATAPRLSVIVTLHDYADVVTETLDSVVAAIGGRDDVEIVVVDDASTDHGRAVVSEFMAAHASTPMLLLGADANRGLPAARNVAVEASRGAYVMVMDADNLLYPTCLDRLEAALDADPTAAFAYATLEAFGAEPGLRSALGWYVPWLTDGNYIDAQAMIRRSTFTRHGGYRIGDPLVYGWEDWELWLRLAGCRRARRPRDRDARSVPHPGGVDDLGVEPRRRRDARPPQVAVSRPALVRLDGLPDGGTGAACTTTHHLGALCSEARSGERRTPLGESGDHVVGRRRVERCEPLLDRRRSCSDVGATTVERPHPERGVDVDAPAAGAEVGIDRHDQVSAGAVREPASVEWAGVDPGQRAIGEIVDQELVHGVVVEPQADPQQPDVGDRREHARVESHRPQRTDGGRQPDDRPPACVDPWQSRLLVRGEQRADLEHRDPRRARFAGWAQLGGGHARAEARPPGRAASGCARRAPPAATSRPAR